MENQEPYNCVQIIINIRGPWLQTVKRIILLAIYTVRVRLLRLVVERAVTLRGHHSVWIILKLGKNSAVGVAARIDKSAPLIEASNFSPGVWKLSDFQTSMVPGVVNICACATSAEAAKNTRLREGIIAK